MSDSRRIIGPERERGGWERERRGEFQEG